MDAAETADLEYAGMEGFPCAEADELEDGLAHVITGLQSIRLGMDTIGTTALRLRTLARKRHTMRYTRTKASAPPLTRSA